MEKLGTVFSAIKSSITLAIFHVYSKHFTTIRDFETSGECVGEKLQECVATAIDTAGTYYPEEYKHCLREAVRRGFNR